jgi:hypothetical protein
MSVSVVMCSVWPAAWSHSLCTQDRSADHAQHVVWLKGLLTSDNQLPVK